MTQHIARFRFGRRLTLCLVSMWMAIAGWPANAVTILTRSADFSTASLVSGFPADVCKYQPVGQCQVVSSTDEYTLSSSLRIDYVDLSRLTLTAGGQLNGYQVQATNFNQQGGSIYADSVFVSAASYIYPNSSSHISGGTISAKRIGSDNFFLAGGSVSAETANFYNYSQSGGSLSASTLLTFVGQVDISDAAYLKAQKAQINQYRYPPLPDGNYFRQTGGTFEVDYLEFNGGGSDTPSYDSHYVLGSVDGSQSATLRVMTEAKIGGFQMIGGKAEFKGAVFFTRDNSIQGGSFEGGIGGVSVDGGFLNIKESTLPSCEISEVGCTTVLVEGLGVGFGGSNATVWQSGGKVTVTNALALGGNGNSVYRLESGDLKVSGYGLSLGSTNSATFAQTGGTFDAEGGIFIGSVKGSRGAYKMSGGKLITPNLNIGYEGEGTFEQSGDSSVAAGQQVLVGGKLDQTGTLTVSGGLLNTHRLEIGTLFGKGTVEQKDGKVQVDEAKVQSGSLNLSGGKFSANATVKTLLHGVLNISDTAVLEVGSGSLEALYGGSVVQTGGTWTAGFLGIESGGAVSIEGGSGAVKRQGTGGDPFAGQAIVLGSLAMKAGRLDVQKQLIVGVPQEFVFDHGTDQPSKVTQSGGSVFADSAWIGPAGGGTFEQTGGSFQVTKALVLGNDAGARAVYAGSGNAKLRAASIELRNDGATDAGRVRFEQTGGGVVTDQFTNIGATHLVNGNYVIGRQQIANNDKGATYYARAATIQGSSDFTPAALIVDGDLSVKDGGSLGLVRSKAEVSGFFEVTGRGSSVGLGESPGSEVVVGKATRLSDHALLDGNGTIHSVQGLTLSSDAEINPGVRSRLFSIGELHLTGGGFKVSGGKLTFDIESPSSYDRITTVSDKLDTYGTSDISGATISIHALESFRRYSNLSTVGAPQQTALRLLDVDHGSLGEVKFDINDEGVNDKMALGIRFVKDTKTDALAMDAFLVDRYKLPAWDLYQLKNSINEARQSGGLQGFVTRIAVCAAGAVIAQGVKDCVTPAIKDIIKDKASDVAQEILFPGSASASFNEQTLLEFIKTPANFDAGASQLGLMARAVYSLGRGLAYLYLDPPDADYFKVNLSGRSNFSFADGVGPGGANGALFESWINSAFDAQHALGDALHAMERYQGAKQANSASGELLQGSTLETAIEDYRRAVSHLGALTPQVISAFGDAGSRVLSPALRAALDELLADPALFDEIEKSLLAKGLSHEQVASVLNDVKRQLVSLLASPVTFDELLTNQIDALQTPIPDFRSPIAAVPEPTAFVLMTCGLFLVAMVVTRRKAQAT